MVKGRRKKDGEEAKKVPVSITIPMDYYVGLREIEAKDLALDEPRLLKKGKPFCLGLTEVIGRAINEYLKTRGVSGYDPIASVRLSDDVEKSLEFIRKHKAKTHSIVVDGIKLSPTRNRLLQRAFLELLKDRFGSLLDEDGNEFAFSYTGEEWQPEIREKLSELAESKAIDRLGSVEKILQLAASEFIQRESSAGTFSLK